MYVCMYVCMYESQHDAFASKNIRPEENACPAGYVCLNPSATQRNYYQVFNIENIIFFLFITF